LHGSVVSTRQLIPSTRVRLLGQGGAHPGPCLMEGAWWKVGDLGAKPQTPPTGDGGLRTAVLGG
jgi:hypothetical protein